MESYPLKESDERLLKINNDGLITRLRRWAISTHMSSIVLIALCGIVMLFSSLYVLHGYLQDDIENERFDEYNNIKEEEECLTYFQDIIGMRNTRRILFADILALERKRVELAKAVSSEEVALSAVKSEREAAMHDLSAMLQQYKLLSEELSHLRRDNNISIFKPFKKETSLKETDKSQISSTKNCDIGTCFDMSKCGILSPFSFYLYPPQNVFQIDNHFYNIFYKMSYRTTNPNEACVLIALMPPSATSEYAKRLPFWNNGSNHILVFTDGSGFSVDLSMVAAYNIVNMRSIDLLMPFILTNFTKHSELPSMIPIMRRHLLSFHCYQRLASISAIDRLVVKQLHELKVHKAELSNELLFDTNCTADLSVSDNEWQLCESFSKRASILSSSTFSLLVCPQKHSVSFWVRFQEALRFGAVPVILGDCSLPFDEVIDWKRVSIQLPKSRTGELYYILKMYSLIDVFYLRLHGRDMYLQYFQSNETIISSAISLMIERVKQLPAPSKDFQGIYPYNKSTIQARMLSSYGNNALLKPPSILSVSSPKFGHNFSIWSSAFERWNSVPGPFVTYSNLPRTMFLPPEVQKDLPGFRPINNGKGGDGRYFSASLGGNTEIEMFTIIILTYDRLPILLNIISNLHGLQHLHKIVVVWNLASNPGLDIAWPDIGVPIVVVRGNGNSLNNRFLPFTDIETEAVLSLDDDVTLSHEEINFAFRVWRENRDRIVGFPGRLHSWNSETNTWFYNRDLSCELSLVLTGAAFFHKYYMHLYHNYMPAEIREKVDELLNCEDLAFNFLVAHVTRKPPIKVTVRRTFLCNNCEQTLWQDSDHLKERDTCINFFEKVFGYNPLIYTQFRADSVLYHTRIGKEEVKCYKSV